MDQCILFTFFTVARCVLINARLLTKKPINIEGYTNTYTTADCVVEYTLYDVQILVLTASIEMITNISQLFQNHKNETNLKI